MKKIIPICLLVISLFVGGITIDAKTTKKKKKVRTTQTSSSALWNGDMPTGNNILKNGSWLSPVFAQKGFREVKGGDFPAIKKDGVCCIEYCGGMGAEQWTITVFDTSKLNWLYQDLKKATSHDKLYSVKINSNIIEVIHDYNKHRY